MLWKSIRGLGTTVIEILRTRLEILSLDVMEARIRFVSILMLGAFAYFLLSLGITVGVFWLLFVYWKTDPLVILAFLSAALLGGGLVLLGLLFWKLRSGPRLFEGSMAELDRDVAALGGRGSRDE